VVSFGAGAAAAAFAFAALTALAFLRFATSIAFATAESFRFGFVVGVAAWGGSDSPEISAHLAFVSRRRTACREPPFPSVRDSIRCSLVLELSAMMNAVSEQIEKLRREIAELEETLPDWEHRAQSQDGSKKYRSISRRIVLSAQHLEELVKENTFSR
jgi:hypothetical protein